jgi:hypothetical protein
MLLYERRIENSIIKITKELKRFQVMRRIELEDADKQQAKSFRSIPKASGFEDATQPINDNRDEAATLKIKQKVDLEKQSQFAVIQVGAKSYLKRDYDNKPADGVEENKATANLTLPNRPKKRDRRKPVTARLFSRIKPVRKSARLNDK